jgi:DmsE family decaheme c-type cytochrome
VGAALVSTAIPMARAEEGGPTSPGATPPGGDPSYVGQAICRSCHPLEAAHWDPTVHGRVFAVAERRGREVPGCEGCHGPGSRHWRDPLNPEHIVAFTRESGASIERMNGMCFACHAGGARIHWRGSRHESQDLACSDCHNPMGRQSGRGLQARESASRTCFTCHPQQRADFRKRSHMPLHEGKISCADCHEPHGSPTDPLIRADSVNQLCYRCHADKRGPFIWEHAPVVESCLGCHRPHGSNHEALLVAPSPFLCQRCHAQPTSFGHPNDLLSTGNLAFAAPPDGRPDERAIGRGCVNCHIQIHGSNHPSGARFHR